MKRKAGLENQGKWGKDNIRLITFLMHHANKNCRKTEKLNYKNL